MKATAPIKYNECNKFDEEPEILLGNKTTSSNLMQQSIDLQSFWMKLLPQKPRAFIQTVDRMILLISNANN
jgi:hypothetical protein